jgi:hypothetical protein
MTYFVALNASFEIQKGDSAMNETGFDWELAGRIRDHQTDRYRWDKDFNKVKHARHHCVKGKGGVDKSFVGFVYKEL